MNKMMCFRNDCWRDYDVQGSRGAGGRPASGVKFVAERYIGWIAVGRFGWSPTTVLGSLCWLFIKFALLVRASPRDRHFKGNRPYTQHITAVRYIPAYTNMPPGSKALVTIEYFYKRYISSSPFTSPYHILQ